VRSQHTLREKTRVTESDTQDGEQRRGPRSSLFLAATIESGGVESPVRIRDLSESGARLEGPAFPPVGAHLTLRRQGVKVGATVKWIRGPRCGVAFEGRVAVSDWVSGKASGTPFGPGEARSAQAEVDAVRAAVRSGAPTPVKPATPTGAFDQAGLDARLAEELAYVRRLLEAIGGELLRDPVLVRRYGTVLQNFDLADQILGHVAAVLKSSDRESAIRDIGMEELRARLLRRSLAG